MKSFHFNKFYLLEYWNQTLRSYTEIEQQIIGREDMFKFTTNNKKVVYIHSIIKSLSLHLESYLTQEMLLIFWD